jgi:hypothetical protein
VCAAQPDSQIVLHADLPTETVPERVYKLAACKNQNRCLCETTPPKKLKRRNPTPQAELKDGEAHGIAVRVAHSVFYATMSSVARACCQHNQHHKLAQIVTMTCYVAQTACKQPQPALERMLAASTTNTYTPNGNMHITQQQLKSCRQAVCISTPLPPNKQCCCRQCT